MRKIVVLVVLGFLILGLATLGFAGAIKVKAKPFVYDLEETGLAAAAWVTHQGLPDAGKSAHALLLQISPAPVEPSPVDPAPAPAATVTPYKAGVVIQGVKGLTITELGFDIKIDAGSTADPRFEVLTGDGTIFTFPLSATVPTPIDGTDWTQVRIDPTATLGSAVVQSVTIILDTEGSVLLDNIDFNGALMGKPGNAKLLAAPKGKKNK
jgi:hypothetical protein